jgi:hypothetical protein
MLMEDHPHPECYACPGRLDLEQSGRCLAGGVIHAVGIQQLVELAQGGLIVASAAAAVGGRQLHQPSLGPRQPPESVAP